MKSRLKYLLLLMVIFIAACNSDDLKNALETVWKVQRLDGNEFMTNQEVVNSNEEIIIAGYQEMEDSITLQNGTLSKINRDGETVWEITTDFSCRTIAIDEDDNIFSAGYLAGTESDARQNKLAKYTTEGDLIWESTYADYLFHVKDLVLDPEGNIIISGTTQYTWDVAKYDAGGTLLWHKSFQSAHSTGDSYHRLLNVLVDSYGDVYLTGTNAADFKAIKYRGSDGELLFINSYDGPYDDADGYTKDKLIAAVLDKEDNLILAGTVILSQVDGIAINEKMIVIKYNSNGDTDWINGYEHPVWARGRIIMVGDLAFDSSNSIIVTGSVTVANILNTFYCYAFKYGEDGTELWFNKDTSNIIPERLKSLKIGADDSLYGFAENSIYHFDKNGKFQWGHETDILGGGRNTLHINDANDVYWIHGPWGYSITKFRKK